jgi:hypothetical protein
LNHPQIDFRNKAAFELSFCFKIGFGIEANEERSLHWLDESSSGPLELQKTLEILKSWKASKFSNDLVDSLFTDGYLRGVHYEVDFPDVDAL